MSLDRTWFNTLVNDNSTNTTGTPWRKEEVDALMDDIDTAIAVLPTTLTNHGVVIGQGGSPLAATSAGTAGQVLTSNGGSADPTYQDAAGGVDGVTTSTVTGAQNDWIHGLGFVHGLIEWNGASDAAFTGIKDSLVDPNETGQRLTIKNITAAKVATFAHNSGSSAAGNRLQNIVTSGPTPIGPSGFITYQFDGTDWKLIAHNQGSPITPAYSAGNFTTNTGTWTVDSGDVTTYSYVLSGKMLLLNLWIQTTSVASSPVQLRIAVPGGFTLALGFQVPVQVVDNSTGRLSQADSDAALAYIRFYATLAAAAWTTSTNATYIIATIMLNVT